MLSTFHSCSYFKEGIFLTVAPTLRMFFQIIPLRRKIYFLDINAFVSDIFSS